MPASLGGGGGGGGYYYTPSYSTGSTTCTLYTTTSTTNVTSYMTYSWPTLTWTEPSYAQPPPPSDDAALARIREATRARNEELRRQEAGRAAAQATALELLKICLDEQQLADFEARQYFEVTGSRGRRWRIRANGQSGNVDLIGPSGAAIGRYCAHPPEYLPDGDAWLAQKLIIETDEDHWLEKANVHWRAPGAALPQARELAAA